MKIFPDTLFKPTTKAAVLFGCIPFLNGCNQADANFSGFIWVNVPFHSVLESFGAFAAVTLAIVLLLMIK